MVTELAEERLPIQRHKNGQVAMGHDPLPGCGRPSKATRVTERQALIDEITKDLDRQLDANEKRLVGVLAGQYLAEEYYSIRGKRLEAGRCAKRIDNLNIRLGYGSRYQRPPEPKPDDYMDRQQAMQQAHVNGAGPSTSVHRVKPSSNGDEHA